MFLDDTAHDVFWRFLKAVRERFRYCRPSDVDAIVQELVGYAADDEQTVLIEEGAEFWRAQNGFAYRGYREGDVEIDVLPYAYNKERMRPHKDYVEDGRANAAGIAYLYAASDIETAIAEVRPWRGGHVSLSRLTTQQDLYLVDFTVHENPLFEAGGDESPDQRRRNLWALFNEEFAKPIDPNGRKLEYIPTQIIAEAMLIDGFDGVKYKSSLGPGYNVLIFHIDAVKFEEAELYRVDRIEYGFNHRPHRRYSDGAEPEEKT